MSICQQFFTPIIHCLCPHSSSCVHDELFSPANKDTEAAGAGPAERRHEWYLSSVCGSVVITHKSLCDPCCHMIYFPQWPAATTERVHVISPTEDEVWMLLVARPRICSGTGKCTPINHTSVVSWMHTNLYVLDLCGRSNLTKIHTSLSSRSRALWLMRTTYIRESERVRRKGETELEEAEKWQIDGSRLWGKGIEKKVTSWLTIRHPSPPDTLHPDFML